jgi:hypothetical protein
MLLLLAKYMHRELILYDDIATRTKIIKLILYDDSQVHTSTLYVNVKVS